MKFVVRFQRKVSVMITIIACASAIWFMVKRFAFPEETVIEFLIMCLVLLFFVILVTAPIALIGRWFADKAGRDDIIDAFARANTDHSKDSKDSKDSEDREDREEREEEKNQ